MMKSRMARIGREVGVELEYFRWGGRDRMKARKGGWDGKERGNRIIYETRNLAN
jgi:hypothetical protein